MKSIKYLENVINNWRGIVVRTVPQVMYQVLCGNDDDIEYRFHWFLDCKETYVHNHRYAFDTYCLDGEYEENIWEIQDDHNGRTIYKFPRTPGNKLGEPIRTTGILSCIKTNHHFPGNTLHVEPNQYHSIRPKTETKNEVLTFVARRICPTAAEMTFVLDESDTIGAPIDKIQEATSKERELVHRKLEEIFSSRGRSILCD